MTDVRNGQIRLAPDAAGNFQVRDFSAVRWDAGKWLVNIFEPDGKTILGSVFVENELFESRVVQTRCAACHEAEFGYEPDMGEDHLSFEPGTCTKCGKEAIVWKPVTW